MSESKRTPPPARPPAALSQPCMPACLHTGPPPAHPQAGGGLALPVLCAPARALPARRPSSHIPAQPLWLTAPPPPPACPPLPAAAHLKVRYYLGAAALLLAFCLAMLGANAGLTYHVVKMSQETRLEASGKLTDRSGSRVVGE